MEFYKNVFVSEKKIVDVVCNMCGEKIKKVDNNLCDYLHIEKEWSYFSSMDNEKHSFDLCQDCYKKIINQFKISEQNKEQ